MTDIAKAVDRIRDAVAGWRGKFVADDDALFYLRDDCQTGTCDCSVGECGYTIATDLDDHIAESLAVLLNASRALMPVVEAAQAWRDSILDFADEDSIHPDDKLIRAIDNLRTTYGQRPEQPSKGPAGETSTGDARAERK